MTTNRFCALATTALILASCSDDNPWMYADGEGGIRPALKADATVKDVVPSTRAEDVLTAPDVTQFQIGLKSSDGSYNKTWESLSQFPADGSYKIGGYTMEAWYGVADEEGFGKPYWYGSQEFVVNEGETTDVSITASLANCMVSIDYTEDFKHFFPQYSTKLHSAGGEYIEYAAEETRPVFLNPGEVSFLVSLTKQNGISGTFEPASITTEAKHHYHVTFDANQGDNGDVQLQILFDDSLETENVEIDLTDDLMLSPAPRVACQGFTPGEVINMIEGSSLSSPAKFTVIATSGLTAVTLTTQSQSLLSRGWPAEIDLLSATAAQKSQMEAMGLKTIGLGNKPGQMAQIDMTDVLNNLSGSEEHTFTIVAKDRLTKVNEPVSLKVNTEPINVTISNVSVGYGETKASAVINYNGDDLTNNVKLQIFNSYGVWQDVNMLSATPVTRAGTDYNVTFEVPAATKEMKVRVLYHNIVKSEATIAVTSMALNIPDYNVWATKAIANVGVSANYNFNDVKIFVAQGNGSFSEWTNLTKDASAKTISINGLTPGTSYKISGSVTGSYDSNIKAASITTEQALQPENANMDTWSETQHAKQGIFGAKYWEYFCNSTATPGYWATRNPMTVSNTSNTNSYSNACGTYYVANGSGRAAAISTVNWGGGSTWAGAISTLKNQSAGYLFMGEYSYVNGTENFNFGRPFASRPNSISFDYKFSSVNSEEFKAYIVVENRNGGTVTELGRGTFISGTGVDNFTNHTINITYTNTSLKATHAYLVFVSSTAESPSVDKGHHDSEHPGGNCHQGNILKVDNIVFNY